MNRWWLTSLCAFSFGLAIGQKFFNSPSHGQRSPTAVAKSYLDLSKSKRLTGKTKTLSEQIHMDSAPIEEAAPAMAENASEVAPAESGDEVAAAPAPLATGATGFLEQIKDINCCGDTKANDLHLAKLDRALDQTCTSLEKSCLEALWNEIMAMTDTELMSRSAERYIVRYAPVEPVLVMNQTTDLARKDPALVDVNAFATVLGFFYEKEGKGALDYFFNNQSVYGPRAAEFAKQFIMNEMNTGDEGQSQLMSDLSQHAPANELAAKMRKRVFSEWYDRDPEGAQQYAESQGATDLALTEIVSMKRQIASVKARLQNRSPASGEQSDPTGDEIRAQIEMLEKQLANYIQL